MNEIDMSLVDWSRAQFALTAMYHWLFVPLTLGLSFIVAIMESVYVKTGNPEWKRITKFWMTLFGINFAIGVSTGIILEFEFGTNWSKYSWIVGDIFGAPLAVEGILAFFLESTFIAVMFFGWNKVSKNFHLLSSWLVAFGSNLSALWILVANGWMQSPVGMAFNPDTARSEMINFWDVLFNPTAIHKFLHTIASSYIVASLFVVGISAWYILKYREIQFAKRSIIIASVFGLIVSLFTAITGDSSAAVVAEKQPMKLAAMEGLYQGKTQADLVAVGILNPAKDVDNVEDEFLFKISVPGALSFLAYKDFDAFVPGVNDLVYGNHNQGIVPAQDKIEIGKKAIQSLQSYKVAKREGKTIEAEMHAKELQGNYKYIGYGYFTDIKDLIPNIAITFYSFHIMVALGGYFIVLFGLVLFLLYKDKLVGNKLMLNIMFWSIPLGYIASQAGWVVAEVGRQPWTIQDILPTFASTSHISTGHVQTTFFLFLAFFTILLIAEIGIMIKTIKKGPKGGEHV